MDLNTMEKKNQLRPAGLSNKDSFDTKSTDNFSKKNGSQFPRKRDYEKFDKKSTPNRNNRACQRYVRPREKADSQIEKNFGPPEIGSLQRSGRKKQNDITHSVQNWYGPLHRPNNRGNNGYHSNFGKKTSGHAKYNKEHYLQANCQFIVIAGKDYAKYEKEPDHLVDWDFIEEVWLHMTEPPFCPICLYPPKAPKITRCGHIYCFSCALHYLALSDDKWRGCPICEQPIAKKDLKSAKAILQRNWNSGEEIQLQLMRRDRDSLIPRPVSSEDDSCDWSVVNTRKKTTISDSFAVSSYSKLIKASHEQIVDEIVLREISELINQFDAEKDEPEACFVQAALDIVTERLDKITSSLKNIEKENINSPNSLNIIKIEGNVNCANENMAMMYDAKSASFEDNLASQLKNVNLSTKLCDDPTLDSCHSQIEKPYENGAKPIYFYQESGGSRKYLQVINIKMLLHQYGSIENCPKKIIGTIVEKESVSMNEFMRQRFKFLSHLPISSSFELVELYLLDPPVSSETMAAFENQLEQRARVRRRKVREEHKIERRAQVEEDKLMGRARSASSINMTSFKHFPTFSPEDLPPVALGNPVYEEEFPTQDSASVSSTSPTPGNESRSSHPSFAQMIRDGQRRPSRPIHKAASTAPNTDAWDEEQSNSSWEEEAGVPDFRNSFVLDIEAAASAAGQLKNEHHDENCKGKKKKGRKKKIVLFSSGGYSN